MYTTKIYNREKFPEEANKTEFRHIKPVKTKVFDGEVFRRVHSSAT